MKQLRTIVVVAMIAIFGLTACGKKGGAKAATPKAAIKNLVEAVKTKNWGAVYDTISNDSAQKLEKMLKGFISMAAAMAKANPAAAKNPKMKAVMELAELSGKEFFIKMLSMRPEISNKISATAGDLEILKEEINGDKATLTIKSGGRQDTIPMVKEDGTWKIDFAQKLKGAMGGK